MSENDPNKNEEIVPKEKKGNGSASPDEQKAEVKPLEEIKFDGGDSEKSGRVCITYGRDQIMNKQVVSLIRDLGIDPLLMQDTSNKTKPIAQFFTEHPGISFVIAILSADDWVYPKDSKPKDALMYADQEIVFHLGFWIGRLGRNRVFALYYDQRSFRWPTEHFDVIYTPLDRNNAWKKELVSRLKASGIKVNTEQQ